MPSGAKKRRAARRKQQEKETNINTSTDFKGLSSDTISTEIDDANALVAEGIAVDDSAKPVITLTKDVAALGLKKNEEKMLPPIHENILDEPHSVMNTLVFDLAKLVDALSEEVSNIDDIVTEDETKEIFEKLLPSLHVNILEEPHPVMDTLAMPELAKPVDALPEEVSNMDDEGTEDVTKENIEQLLPSLHVNIVEEPHPAMDTQTVADFAKPYLTLSDEISIDYNVTTEDVAASGLKEDDEKMQPSVIENILAEPNSEMDVIDVADSANKVVTSSDEVTNVDDAVTEEVVSSGLKEIEEKMQLSMEVDITDEPHEVSELNEAEDILQTSNVNAGSLTSSTTDNLLALEFPGVETSTGKEHDINSGHKSLEPQCAFKKILPDQCSLHCTFYQWISKELSKASTGEVEKAADEGKNMMCAEQVDRIKKLVFTELQVADKMGIVLRKLLDDLKSIKVSEGKE